MGSLRNRPEYPCDEWTRRWRRSRTLRTDPGARQRGRGPRALARPRDPQRRQHIGGQPPWRASSSWRLSSPHRRNGRRILHRPGDPDGGQSGCAAAGYARLPGGASVRRASHHRRVGQTPGRREGEARAEAILRPPSPLCGAQSDRQVAGDDGAAGRLESAGRIETACSW